MNAKCAWCGDELKERPGTMNGAGLVSHGICESCRRTFFSRSLGELDLFLDTLAVPVLVLDGDATVSYANRAARTLLGKDLPEIRGFKNGQVFECINARLPGGCGKTDQCPGCLLRRTVEETYATGGRRENVSTLVTRFLGGRRQTVRMLVSTEKIENVVLLRIDASHSTRP